MTDHPIDIMRSILAEAHLPEKDQLLGYIDEVEHRLQRQDFKLKRTLKDKSITVNLLNRTIEDLQEKNRYIAETNQLLEQQAEELRENNHELEQFAHIASHDLKSPVRNIHSFAQLLQDRYAHLLPMDGNEFLDFIIRSSLRMHEVLDDLSVFSEVSRTAKEFEMTDLNEILRVVEFGLSDEIERTKCSVQSAPLPKLPVIRSGIYQLFLNLISNAIKFQNGHSPKIEIDCEKQGTFYSFSVTDNGIGIPESFAEKIFQPFQRLSDTKPGTGIGLAICKRVVQLHGGEIGFGPGPRKKGTRFTFTIPVSNDKIIA